MDEDPQFSLIVGLIYGGATSAHHQQLGHVRNLFHLAMNLKSP
jgi:hypothetical protein